jgi:hypothetical protein
MGMGMSFAGGMRKAEQVMRMTEYRMVAPERGNRLCGEERMRKAEQGMEMAEQRMVTEHGMAGYPCSLNK